MRLDVFLFEKGMANSRTQAQEFIKAGHVFLKTAEKDIILNKTSYDVSEAEQDNIFVVNNDFQKYVSRAGLKLESALKNLKIDVKNKKVLDVGQSTGGFTDCLLQFGAAFVVGFDVGHSQLSDSLKSRSNFISIEGLNAKNLNTDSRFLEVVPKEGFDLIVMDVSFISITKIINDIAPFLKKEGEFLFLVKPQFECGREFLDKDGIVRDNLIYDKIEKDIKEKCVHTFNSVEAYISSGLLGKDGNKEFFVYGKNNN